uniref:Uncharacterized protein n=1 Tax=Bombyx mori TaxID=7091 RepID=A0A8R2HPE3_BOMMO|nr:uncharacterized protein DDB_G0271670 [Bombyx mori]
MKSEKKRKHKLKTKEKELYVTTRNSYFPATQMIFSERDSADEEENVSISSDSSASDNEIQSGNANKKSIEKTSNKAEVGNEQNNKSDFASSDSEVRLKKKIDENKTEIVFVDTHKNDSLDKLNSNNHLFDNYIKNTDKNFRQYVAITSTVKTRYDKIRSYKKGQKYLESNDTRYNLVNHKVKTAKRVKKILRAETFANFWDDIKNNKPIKLETQGEIEYEVLDGRNKAKGSLTERVITAARKNEEKENRVETTEESSENGDLSKEIFTTSVLRHAYEDACLRHVVKNCYTACKKTKKSFCGKYRCKSAFKTEFLSAARTGCLREFQGNAVNSSSSVEIEKEPARDRQLDTFCLSRLHSEHEALKLSKNTTKNIMNSNSFGDVHILRDKYEKACKEHSVEKCRNACTFSSKEACKKSDCGHSKTKSLRRSCKTQCRSAFKLYSEDSSDSDSSSSSSSESSSSSSSGSSDDNDSNTSRSDRSEDKTKKTKKNN